jgi:hypothetical protein
LAALIVVSWGGKRWQPILFWRALPFEQQLGHFGTGPSYESWHSLRILAQFLREEQKWSRAVSTGGTLD